jgi:Cu2+-exporting ATPase
MDVRVTFPAADRIDIHSDRLFGDPTNGLCRDFARRVMQSAAVFELTIRSGARQPASAEVRFCTKTETRQSVVEEICSRLVGDEGQYFYDQSDKSTAIAAGSTRRSSSRNGRKKARPAPPARLTVGPVHEPQMYCDAVGTVRLYRHGPIVSSWKVLHELPGRMRLHHPALHRRKEVCQAIDRELMSVLGIDHYKTHAMSATVLVKYDPCRLRREQVIEILESVVTNTLVPAKTDDVDLHFPLATASLPLAAVAEFALPVLLPFSAALFVYTAIPSFKGAHQVIFKERRLGVDVLDSIVVLGCLSTGAVFAGSVLCWCLGFGRMLFQKTQDDSTRMLISVFGKAPRFVWLYRDGVEIETPLNSTR